MTQLSTTHVYQESVDHVVASLGSHAAQGLSSAEAQKRLSEYGPNELQVEAPILAWRKFLA